MTAVRQFVTILLNGLAGEVNVEQRQYVEIVLRNVKQLHSMINDLFEVSGRVHQLQYFRLEPGTEP